MNRCGGNHEGLRRSESSGDKGGGSQGEGYEYLVYVQQIGAVAAVHAVQAGAACQPVMFQVAEDDIVTVVDLVVHLIIRVGDRLEVDQKFGARVRGLGKGATFRPIERYPSCCNDPGSEDSIKSRVWGPGDRSSSTS